LVDAEIDGCCYQADHRTSQINVRFRGQSGHVFLRCE
jgi:hypothetical protein